MKQKLEPLFIKFEIFKINQLVSFEYFQLFIFSLQISRNQTSEFSLIVIGSLNCAFTVFHFQ